MEDKKQIRSDLEEHFPSVLANIMIEFIQSATFLGLGGKLPGDGEPLLVKIQGPRKPIIYEKSAYNDNHDKGKTGRFVVRYRNK